MCRVLGVHRSGFYTWLHEPPSKREADDDYLLGYIKQFWLESGCVYGYRKIYKDMLAIGEQCGKHRVHRICVLPTYSLSVATTARRITALARYLRLHPIYSIVNLR